MTAAWLLTGLAILGVVLGASLGQSRALSVHLAAAGGGLLSGIGLFWLIPEIAESTGWLAALFVPIMVSALLAVVERYLLHTGRSIRHGVVTPLLAATALHSLLDGWSIRALEVQPMANFAVLLGLALHKLPEGLALGWLTRRSLHSTPRAVTACGAAELLTPVGAWVEPPVASSGITLLGATAGGAALMLVAGSFLFLGAHTALSDRKKPGIIPIFLSALLLAGILAWVRETGH